ncbi:hypothetical protein [Streptomyces exfoliatus]|uniref:hypothetical protein n=1 Tax=Streptomyces exfoliatus TaxID=1905 RepID=UPI00147074EA|nr:hypothetical protein [Streptomyces exfoliatus]
MTESVSSPAPGPAPDPDARRRSRRRTLLLALLLLLLAVTGLILWIFIGPDGDDGADDARGASPRAELTRAANLLRDLPALHYTGTMGIAGAQEAAGGEDAQVDLIVSNPADALGTLAMPSGPALDYVGIDGKSFLRGETEAWRGFGMAEKSKVLAEHPSMVQPGMFFSQDLATTLAPPALAKTVRAEDVPDEKITIGTPVTMGDHTCTPFHVDDTTICLSDQQADGARFVDRISFGDTAVLDVEVPSRSEVERFSTDFRAELPEIRDAVDHRIDVTTQILRDYKGKCAPTACVFTARVTVTYLGSTSEPDASKAVPVTYSWAVDRDGTPVELDPECSGTLTIKPGKSKDLSCTATGPSVGEATQGQYHGEIHVSDRALTEEEHQRLLRLAADNSEKIAALPDPPTPR